MPLPRASDPGGFAPGAWDHPIQGLDTQLDASCLPDPFDLWAASSGDVGGSLCHSLGTTLLDGEAAFLDPAPWMTSCSLLLPNPCPGILSPCNQLSLTLPILHGMPLVDPVLQLIPVGPLRTSPLADSAVLFPFSGTGAWPAFAPLIQGPTHFSFLEAARPVTGPDVLPSTDITRRVLPVPGAEEMPHDVAGATPGAIKALEEEQQRNLQIVLCNPNDPATLHPRPSERRNVLKQRSTVIKHLVDKHTGRRQGSMVVFGREQKTRRAGLTRTLARGMACRRCRKHKRKCIPSVSPFVPCAQCVAFAQPLHQPCIHPSLVDIDVPDIMKTGLIYRQVMNLVNEHMPVYEQAVQVTQDLGVSFRVHVSTFASGSECPRWASLDRWDHEGTTPCYVTNLQAFGNDLWLAVDKRKKDIIMAALKHHDALKAESTTFDAAFKYCEESKSILVSRALSLWAATRTCDYRWAVGAQPAGRIMQLQLESAACRLVEKLGAEVLSLLHAKMRGGGTREDWPDIFFAAFVVLSNVDHSLAASEALARSSTPSSSSDGGGQGLFDRLEARKAEGVVWCCRTILAYFHFVCKGGRPLRRDLRVTGAGMKSMTAADYVRDIRRALLEEGPVTGRDGGSMTKTKMYWAAQLMGDWTEEQASTTPQYDLGDFAKFMWYRDVQDR